MLTWQLHATAHRSLNGNPCNPMDKVHYTGRSLPSNRRGSSHQAFVPNIYESIRPQISCTESRPSEFAPSAIMISQVTFVVRCALTESSTRSFRRRPDMVDHCGACTLSGACAAHSMRTSDRLFVPSDPQPQARCHYIWQ